MKIKPSTPSTEIFFLMIAMALTGAETDTWAAFGDSAPFALDTRNFTESSEHTFHTDARAYLTSDTVPGSLRQAIANAATNDTVDFDGALDGATTTLGGTELTLDKSLTIDASALPGGITVSGNNASRVFDNAGGHTVAMQNLTIADGAAGGSGGGILNAGMLTLNDVTLSNNTSSLGGGAIASEGIAADLSITNSTITGNTALFAGGIRSLNGALRLIQSTAVANTGTGGSGGLVLEGGSATLANTIVADNIGTADPDIGGAGTALTVSGKNLVGRNNGNYAGSLPADGILIGTVALPVQPLLAPIADYGGPTPTMPPLPGSPVIESAVLLGGTPPTDQRGAPRPSGPLPDIGAVEAFPFSTLPLVDTDNDGIDDRLEPGYGFVVGTDDSMADTDGDGSFDAEEIANMTDPNDFADNFRYFDVRYDGVDVETNVVVEITMRTFPGLGYGFDSSSVLQTFEEISGANFISTNHEATLQVTIPAGDAFLRAHRN